MYIYAHVVCTFLVEAQHLDSKNLLYWLSTTILLVSPTHFKQGNTLFTADTSDLFTKGICETK